MEQTNINQSQPKKSNWGCYLIGGLGCLWIVVMIGLLVGAIVYFVYKEESDITEVDDWFETVNTNLDTNLNINLDTNTNSDSDTNYGIAITDPLSDIDAAYQVIAYPTTTYIDSEYPGIQATIENVDVPPLTNADDSVFIWVGATLLNDYFIQVGMSSSDTVDENGNMQWNYFWEMWDDQDNYLYGFQDPLSTYGWDNNKENTFTISCQDPATGEWEFWINDEVVGTTNTGSCAMDVADTSLVWELTSPTKPGDETLPKFLPTNLTDMQYWDGYDWVDVESATLTYGYGLIKEGTEIDPASVCPPYGVELLANGFSVGSDLECLPDGAELWSE